MTKMRWTDQKGELQRIFRCDAAQLPVTEIRLHPYCHFGKTSEREGWRSIVTGELWPPSTQKSDQEEAPTLTLAKELWEKDQPPVFKEVANMRLIAVADPLACLVTLAYSANEKTCSGDFLEACFHHFFRHIRPYERWLAQRPGLQLVVVGSSQTLFRRLQTAFQDALRRMGEAAADLGVHWVEEGPSESILPRILSGHPPTAPWATANTPEPNWLKSEEGSLTKDLELLQRVGEDIFALGGCLSSIVDQPSAQPTSPRELLKKERSPVSLVGLRMAVRRFLPDPLTVTLAPLSLIASENASGKTTLVEGICQAYLARPRVRLGLPERAGIWSNGDELLPTDPRTAAAAAPSPEIVALRLHSEADTALPERAALFCLFADDADLPSGESGETALAAWWFLGDESGARLGKAVTGLQSEFDRLEQTVRLDVQVRTADSEATETWDPQKFSRELLIHGIQREEDSLAERHREQLDLVEASQSLVNGSAEAPLESEEIRRTKLRDLRRQLETGNGISRTELKELLPLFTDELRRPEYIRALDEDAWDALADASVAFGRPTELHARAKELALIELENAKRRLGKVSSDIERHLINDDVGRLEQQLYGFLDTALVHRPTDQIRPNTARQVQRAQAARLARVLAVGGADLPLIVIDEPTLGQDPPSAARSMARYLRLRRATESLRWAQFLGNKEHHAPSLAKDQWKNGEISSTSSALRQTDASADRFRSGPFSPQLILTSYQTPALLAVAEVEGTLCDTSLRKHLRELIPAEWRRAAADALIETAREFSLLAGNEADWARCPAECARALWKLDLAKLPAKDLDAPNDYLKRAAEALTELGLFGLRSEIRRVGSDTSAANVARRLLRWMLLTDLLPAAFADGEQTFVVSGVSVRMFPAAGGEATEFGSARLRRITPFREYLPPDPMHVASASDPPSIASASDPAPSSPPLATPSAEERTLKEAPHATSGVWRVRGIAPNAEALTNAIRESGMLPSDPTLVHEVSSVEVKGELPDPDEDEYEWTVQRLVSIPGIPVDASFSGTLSSLSKQLIGWRYSSWMAVDAPEEPLGVSVSTYGETQIPGKVAFLLSATLPTSKTKRSGAQNKWRETIERRIQEPLRSIHAHLSRSPETRRIRIYPKCFPGLAIRIGALFHRSTGFSVECDQGGELWNIDHSEQPAQARQLARTFHREGGSDGIHLLLSIAQPVRTAYEVWRKSSSSPAPAAVLELTPVTGTDRNTVPKAEVVPMAVQISQRIMEQAGGAGKLRIFCAAPNALAMALGRELNAFGEIVTMDWDKDTGAYVETAVFRS